MEMRIWTIVVKLRKTNVGPKQGLHNKVLYLDLFMKYNMGYVVVSCFFT